MTAGRCSIAVSDTECVSVVGYRRNSAKSLLAAVATIASLGFIQLLFYWKPAWRLWFTSDICDLEDATLVYLSDEHYISELRVVRRSEVTSGATLLPCAGGQFIPVDFYKYFSFRKLNYVWQPSLGAFAALPLLDVDVTCDQLHLMAADDRGLSTFEAVQRLCVYGRNVIAVRLKPILVLLFREVISPFYVFQVFSVIVWYTDEYAYYASVIVLMSVLSIGIDVYQTRSQEVALRDMVHSTDVVRCVRDGAATALASDELVPGDLVHVPPHGCVLQYDAVLLTGTCIVNESMLTGESVPVTKTPLPLATDDAGRPQRGAVFSAKEHAKHTLHCGTQVLQTRYYRDQAVRALVIRTGYGTVKGQLVRSIMYPKPVDFSFTRDLIKFVGVLATIAAFGFVYAIFIMLHRDADLKQVVLRSLDIITIVVPPALPAAMTIGIISAQMRLKRRRIFCISPSTINTCGGINLVCFDKTGTLTEEGLDFHCAVPAAAHATGAAFTDARKSLAEPLLSFPFDGAMVRAAASCHSLTRVGGELVGDPLDLIIFRDSQWRLEEPTMVDEAGQFDTLIPTVVKPPPGDSGDERLTKLEIGILRQFTFSSQLQRMSVVVRELAGTDLSLYVKGAPERVASLCQPATVPEDFDAVVESYARRGFRIIGVARRSLRMSFAKVQRVAREAVECELEFLGLVALENRLKPETQPVIAQLNDANIRSVMVTGDNLLTAISVARECAIVDERDLYVVEPSADRTPSFHLRLVRGADEPHSNDVAADVEADVCSTWRVQLAVTGATLALLSAESPQLVEPLVCVCNVFARMAPEQKARLVNIAQDVGYTVAMCGDGANDCGALKAAHAGISLSEAEASIASPFTSQTADIRCVPIVIRQGRAALVSSFGVFKYMAGYSLTQFISVCLLYWIATNLSDFQFLYIDLFLITSFALVFGRTDAAERLSSRPPPVRILSIPSVLSIILQLVVVLAVQMFMFVHVARQPWFVPYTQGDEESYVSYRGTVVFLASTFQYVALAVIYSKSAPHRKPIYDNRLLCLALFVCTGFSLWVCLSPPQLLVDFLELKVPPVFEYRLFVLGVAALGCVVAYLLERWVVDWYLMTIATRQGAWAGPQRSRYDDLRADFASPTVWVDRLARGRRLARTPSPHATLSDDSRSKLSDDGVALVIDADAPRVDLSTKF